MLKSILKNQIIYDNNISRKFNKNNYKILIIFSVSILFLGILSFNHTNRYNTELRRLLDSTNNLLVSYGFYLQKINITGVINIKKNFVLNSVYAQKYETIFDINLFKIHNILLMNQWVKSVQIERILPNSINIKIKEKKPLAIWQTKTGNKLITKDGSIISIINVTKFKNQLPIIIGEEADKKAFVILQILQTIPDLYTNVWSISYINKRRWDIHFKQGLTIQLPKENIYNSWKKIYFLQNQYKILNLGLTEIDIRNKNKIFGKINFDKNLYLKRKNYENN